ncbi:uncharacterized protein METZ01_LOCUS404815, partial [marine metagenome]
GLNHPARWDHRRGPAPGRPGRPRNREGAL